MGMYTLHRTINAVPVLRFTARGGYEARVYLNREERYDVILVDEAMNRVVARFAPMQNTISFEAAREAARGLAASITANHP
jgi:hypothetical protein